MSEVSRFEVSVTGPDIPLFRTEPRISVGGRPEVVVLEDVDEDGLLDVITANNLSDDVSILLGQGDGSFRTHTRPKVGSGPAAMALGDVDGDEHLDVVIANGSGDSISVLLGDGTGDFARLTGSDGNPMDIPLGVLDFPSALALGKIDHDDVLDLIVANNGTDSVSVLLGTGDGRFTLQDTIPVGRQPAALALAKDEAERVEYIVIANNASDSISVLLVDSDGKVERLFDSVGNAMDIPIIQAPSAVAVVDLNNNNILDLVVAHRSEDSNAPGRISVFLDLDFVNGSFVADETMPNQTEEVGRDPSALAFGDLNNDTILDIVIANRADGELSLLFGLGMGAFLSQGTKIVVGGETTSVVLGKVDSGDALDVVAANRSSDDISILLGNGDGTFPVQPGTPIGGDPTVLAMGNLNEDNISDLVVANRSNVTLKVLLGSMNGSFQEISTVDLQSYISNENNGISSIALGRINEDKYLDLVVSDCTSPGHIVVLSGQGDGNFMHQTTIDVGDEPSAVILGDLRRDENQEIDENQDVDEEQKRDIVVANRLTRDVSVLLGDGNFHFTVLSRISLGGEPSALALGKVNESDGDLDLIVADREGNQVTVLLGNGDGTFAQPAVLLSFSVGSEPTALTLGDVNADGHLDAVVANSGTNDVSILFGQGNGSFSGQLRVTVGDSPSAMTLADVDADGRLDIIVANEFSNDVSVLLNQGENLFATQSSIPVAGRPSAVVAGHFDDDDGDGDVDVGDALDVIAANRTTGNLSALLSAKELKRVPVIPETKVFTLDGRAVLAVELTLPNPIPEGPNRLF